MKAGPQWRSAARYVGIAWITVVVLAGAALIGMGILRGSRGPIYLLFGAALPGIVVYKWGSRTDTATFLDTPRPRMAPIVRAKGDSHALEMDTDPPTPDPFAAQPESNGHPATPRGPAAD